jgi:putative oxidoreductase
MKIASLIARLLLGLIFLAFGLNGFLHFIPLPPPSGVAAQFYGALVASPFWTVIFAVQVIGGTLLLLNRFVPLALVALAAVIVNILAFHIFMAPAGLPLALFVGALWTVVALRNKQYLASLFVARTESEARIPVARRDIYARG